MDKKNLTIGVGLLVAAFAVQFLLVPRQTPPAPQPTPSATIGGVESSSTPATAGATTPAGVTAAAVTAAPGTAGTNPLLVPVAVEPADAKIVTLQNELLTVRLSDFGGAILDAELRKHRAELKGEARYDFNGHRAAPILGFVAQPGLDARTRWDIVSSAADTATFRTIVDGKLEVTRTFSLPLQDVKGEGYRLTVQTKLRNVGTEAVGAQRVAWHLGTATLINAHDMGLYLTTGFFDGSDTHYTDRNALAASSGFLGMGGHAASTHIEKLGAVRWASVKNQYFISLFTPSQPGVGVVTRRVHVLTGQPETNPEAIGISGDVLLDLPRVEPGATVALDGKLYIGPAEYKRLSEFEQKESKAMQFDLGIFNRIFFAGVFAPLLLMLMNFVHTYLLPDTLSAWGWAIVLSTLILRTIFLPLNLSAAKSAKRMAKIQPLLKEINEKYADNPQKKQKETLALFSKAKVNPLGGCLPILITMPFFIGFYSILQTSSELRFAEFLWIKDLAAADTVARIPLFGFNIPLNIMPLLMGVTQVVQMRLVPTPSLDNAQAKMMQFMPFVMVAICYNFGSGLALYWTISNLFTIGQQLVVNRMPDVDPLADSAATTTTKDGRREKNVTPAKPSPKNRK